jgi:bifunctional non-homologous end joining protein LigD
MRGLPYHCRRELLLELALDGPAWSTPRHFVGQPDAVLAATARLGLEGVVAKRLDCPYLAGARSGAWVKQKHRRTESFLVSGWMEAEARRPESLLLARAGPDGGLEPAGSVPLALPGRELRELRSELERLVLPATRRRQRVRRLQPELVATVAFHGPPHGPVRDPLLRAIGPIRDAVDDRPRSS